VNPVTTSNFDQSVTRRTALAGLGASGLGLALAATVRHAAAQDTTAEMAKHPMVGTWLSGTGPTDLAVVHWDADGDMTNNGFLATPGPDGTTIHSNPFAGVWEPDGARGIHITFMAMTFDATGAVTGTLSFIFLVDEQDEDRYYAIEQYADRAAQQAHAQGAVIQRWAPKIVPLLAGVPVAIASGDQVDLEGIDPATP
jgi:quinol monooxygenase YgiN